MTYRYLTRAFVEWLELDIIPITKLRDQAVRGYPRFDGNPLAGLAGESRIVGGVQHDGRLYEREPDGLAYARLGA